MCGIVGLVKTGSVEVLERMNSVQSHRGPDAEGSYEDSEQRIFLGMKRLIILDSSGGKQPMMNEDKSICLVFNGEIFNASQLRKDLEAKGRRFNSSHSDTEVILRAYEEYGERVAGILNGMFSFLIYDKKRKRVYGARDPFGIKPLYLGKSGSGYAFSSEMKSLLKVEGIDTAIDSQAVYDYLTYQSIPNPRTIYCGIQKVEPGHYFDICLETMNLSKVCYWTPGNGSYYDKLNEEDLDAWVRQSLGDAVSRWKISDVPVAVSLSGGVDSAVLTQLLSERSSERIKTFTLGFENAPDMDERAIAREVSRRYNTVHQEIVIQERDILGSLDAMYTALEEPYGGGLPSWFIYKAMKGNTKVCFTGSGGDELFGNYGKWLPYVRKRSRIKRAYQEFFRGRGWLKTRDEFPIGAFYHQYFREHEKREWVLNDAFTKDVMASERYIDEIVEEIEPITPMDIPRVVDMRMQLPDEFMHMTDAFSMAFSIEARTPFLDKEFVNRMEEIPAGRRFKADDPKFLLRRAFRETLPTEVCEGKKKGFNLPVSKWLRTDLRPIVTELFTEDLIRSQGIFKPDLFKRIVKPHIDGTKDYGGLVWTLFMFQYWYYRHRV